jgi:DMSO/TMAO reductase YedYZ heme-binding membrane subunit
MESEPERKSRRPHGSGFHWALIAFLAGYVILLLGLSHFYLVPAFRAVQEADPEQRDRLGAYSTLLLAVVLAVLVVGLLLTFRVRRYFTGDERPREKTNLTDAWSESGARKRDR